MVVNLDENCMLKHLHQCKIEKGINFTHLISKITHINQTKNV